MKEPIFFIQNAAPVFGADYSNPVSYIENVIDPFDVGKEEMRIYLILFLFFF